MTFAEPQFLFALVLLPLAGLFLWWMQRRRRAALALLGDAALVQRLSAGVNWNGRLQRTILWFLALALVIVALARPQWGSQVQVVEQEGVQIMVVLDVSSSMLAQDVQPNRLTRAKQTISELMDRLNGDEIGLVLFSGASFIQFPLTSDYSTARSFLDAAQPGIISRPGTVLGEAIRTALGGFDPQRASQKVILILTDGESHDDDPLAAAQEAADAGAVLYAIGFGSPDGEPIPEYDANGQFSGYKKDQSGEVVLSRLDEATLQQIVGSSGQYFRATAAGAELDALLAALDNLQKAQLDSRLQTLPIERFQIFLSLAILALLGAELIPERKNMRRLSPLRRFSLSNLRGLRNLWFVVILFFLTSCAANTAQLVEKGNEAFAAQEYDQALQDYVDAQQTAPELAEPVYNAANTRYRQDGLDEAQQLMQNALAQADGELAQFSHYNLGNFYFDQQDYAAAVEAYKEALRLNPNDQEAKYNLELALQQLQQQQQEQQNEDNQEQQDEGEETADSTSQPDDLQKDTAQVDSG
ncbi:MAG: VWA domain-containing protein [Chloroflexota bacterium]